MNTHRQSLIFPDHSAAVLSARHIACAVFPGVRSRKLGQLLLACTIQRMGDVMIHERAAKSITTRWTDSGASNLVELLGSAHAEQTMVPNRSAQAYIDQRSMGCLE